MNQFEQLDLPKSLKKAIDDLGFQSLTPIQQKSFPVILSGRDMIGIAQTGTGKTLAYLLPILKQYKFHASDLPKVVIIVPTRELVVQVAEETQKLTQYMSTRVLGIYGGVNINTQKKAVYEGVDILIATPGRLMDLALDNVVRFDDVKKLVIDEFDEMLNLGFSMQVTSILAMMKMKRQNILFSATMTEEVDQIINDYFDQPQEVSLAPSGTPLENIQQKKYFLPNFITKINLLNELLLTDDSIKRVLIFVNNKRIVELIHERLDEKLQQEIGVIHSNKTQNYRLNALAELQRGDLRGILTTDIMARGLDIQDVTHVINLEITEIPEQYMHRIGRTGRADQNGAAISMISPREEEWFLEIELLMNQEVETLEIPESVEIATTLMEFEKRREQPKRVFKKTVVEGGGAFHEKKDKNKKVNLGGPGKRKPKKTKPVNRNQQKKGK